MLAVTSIVTVSFDSICLNGVTKIATLLVFVNTGIVPSNVVGASLADEFIPNFYFISISCCTSYCIIQIVIQFNHLINIAS